MREKKKFLLRIDDKVYAALEKWAADDLRSINAQIEFLLTNSIKKAGRIITKSDSLPEKSDHNDIENKLD